MSCSIIYEEMMSLKLDGLLGADDERYLHAHIVECSDCAPIWAAMREADTLLWASAEEPVALPAAFRGQVLAQVAALPVVRPRWEVVPELMPAVIAFPAASVLSPPSLTRQLTGELPLYTLDVLHDWQRKIASYVRGALAVGLAVAGTAGLVLALLLSGVIKVEGPLADGVGTVRTFFSAADTWVRALFIGVGPGLITVATLVLCLLALGGWQVVASYHHRSVVEQRGNTGLLEAVS